MMVHQEIMRPVLLGLVCAALCFALLSRHAVNAQDPLDQHIHLPLVLGGFEGPFDLAPTALPISATPDASPTQTSSTTPSASPTLNSTSTPTRMPLDPWQERLHFHRDLAGLPGVSVNRVWSRGAELHSEYMVKTDDVRHDEDSASPWFTAEGREAAKKGNIFVHSEADRGATDAVDFWMTAPFHQVALLDPELWVSGYGQYAEAIGRWNFGATLDVQRGLRGLADGVEFPLRYPEKDRTLPFLSFNGNEWPDPLPSCPGYRAPTGPPIVLMLGAGDEVPDVRSTIFFDGSGQQYQVCSIDEVTFKHPDPSQRDIGRAILDMRDAIIILPKSPLAPGTEYGVTVINGEDTHHWVFRTAVAEDVIASDMEAFAGRAP